MRKRTVTAAGIMNDPLERSIPFLVRRTARYFRLGIQNRMRQHGLGFSHWFFLRALWLKDGVTQRELCRRIEAAEPAAVTALGGLERGGYIRRVRDRNNLRQSYIFLTEKGIGLRSQLLPYAQGLHDIGVHGIPERDLDIVRRTLDRIRANMSAFLERDGGAEVNGTQK